MDLIEDFRKLLERGQKQQAAELRRSGDDQPFNFQRFRILLDNARVEGSEYEIKIPCKSIYIENASDPSAVVQVSFNSRNTVQGQNYIQMQQRDSISFSDIKSSVIIKNTAQASQWVDIVIALDAEIKSGRNISVNSGGVSINGGSSRDTSGLGSAGTASSVTVTTTATMILPQDSNRKGALLYVDADVRVGDSAVTATTGVLIVAGSYISDNNTAALYAITASGTATVTGNTES